MRKQLPLFVWVATEDYTTPGGADSSTLKKVVKLGSVMCGDNDAGKNVKLTHTVDGRNPAPPGMYKPL